MSNIIVELSNQQANKVVSNADFETTFEPILINQGDVIQMKNAFIDTIQQSYDQIYLPNDITLEWTFFYYLIDCVHAAQIHYNEADVHPNPQYYDHGLYLAFLDENGNGGRTLATGYRQAVLKGGLYTPTSLAVEVTRLMASLPSPQDLEPYENQFVTQIAVGAALYNRHYFVSLEWLGNNQGQFDYDNFYYYMINAPPNDEYFLMGAREVSLVYNDQGDNKFQFQYAHTPYYDDNKQESVSYTSGNYINRVSGVVFTDLQPASFWQSLGFNLDEILFKVDDMNADHPNVTSWNPLTMTTENLITLDDMFFGTNNEIVNSGEKVSNYTRGMSADQFYSFKQLSPYIMIEFMTNFNGLYLSKSDKSRSIAGIVSRNYTQNNFITGYSDSSIVYEHKGEPFILSSIRTRLLDPATKNTCDDLGANNFIILNVLKNS
jgi:hypothetical protein